MTLLAYYAIASLVVTTLILIIFRINPREGWDD